MVNCLSCGFFQINDRIYCSFLCFQKHIGRDKTALVDCVCFACQFSERGAEDEHCDCKLRGNGLMRTDTTETYGRCPIDNSVSEHSYVTVSCEKREMVLNGKQ